MRELVSKLEGACMSACFHMASKARTRAAESYKMAVGLGQAKVQIRREFDWLLGRGDLTGLDGKLTGSRSDLRGFDQFPQGSSNRFRRDLADGWGC